MPQGNHPTEANKIISITISVDKLRLLCSPLFWWRLFRFQLQMTR